MTMLPSHRQSSVDEWSHVISRMNEPKIEEFDEEYTGPRLTKKDLNIKMIYIALMALLLTLGLIGLWVWSDKHFNTDKTEPEIPSEFFNNDYAIEAKR